MQKSYKANKSDKSDVKTLSLRKARKRNYTIASGAICAIVILHFVFQFSFIQSENFKMVQKLTKTGQFAEDEQIAENTVVPEISFKEAEETEQATKNEIRSEVKTVYKAKKLEIIKQPQVKPPVQLRFKSAPSRTVINRNEVQPKKREMQPEIRAEQLRRAEKILTGA
jgi:hypothetical protein